MPLAGVRVSAMSRDEESLAERPCPDWASGPWDSRREEKPRRLLQDCQWSGRDILTEWLSSRRGEAILQAETVTDGGGAYLLDGLDDGALSIWALNEDGAAVQQGIQGTHDDLRLVLTPGLRVEGAVSGEDAPLPGTRITLASVATDRYFDGITGPDGRFRIGPLPLGPYVLMAVQDGWRSALLHLNEANSLPEEGVQLTRPLNHAGRVLSQGSPIAGARVELSAESPEGFSYQVATSDAKGQFHFSGLSKVHRLTLSAFHGGMTASEQVTLDERDGAETVLELKPAPYLEGLVQDEARQPVSGARVSAIIKRHGSSHPDAESGLDGRFRLGPLGPDTHDFMVSAPGYLDTLVNLRSSTNTSSATITLFRATTITGVAVDAHGSPAPGVALTLMRECNPAAPYHLHETTTDETGHFELKACRPGEWEIQARDERFLPETVPVYAPSKDLRLSLRQGPTVLGTVSDEHGAPVPDANVDISARNEEDLPSRHAYSDAQGRFQLGAVQPGHYVVRVRKEILGVVRTVSHDLELREGTQSQVELRFPEGVTVSGVVVTASGKPLEGAVVRAYRASPVAETEPPALSIHCGGSGGARTGADGRFILRHLSSAPHAVEVTKRDHAFVPAQSLGGTTDPDDTFLVSPGEHPIRLVLQRYSRIRGSLLSADGAPILEFTLNGRLVRSEDGAFEWSTTKSGTLTLAFGATGMAPRSLTVDVPLEGDVDLGDLHMSPGRSVQGRLLDAATSAPIEGARLTLYFRAGTAGQRVSHDSDVSNPDGTFTLEHVSDAPSELVVDAVGYHRYIGTVTGGETPLIRLEPGVVADVTVRNHQGAPVEAMLQFWRDGAHQSDTLLVRNEKATHPGLEPGFYTVRASATSAADGAVPHFAPQRVHVPDGGRLTIDFVEQTTGATVTLLNPSIRGVYLSLHPGRIPAPTTEAAAEFLAKGRGFINPGEEDASLEEHDAPSRTTRFRNVPPGPATIFLLSGYVPVHFHREELTIPASGEIVHTLVPNWQPLPSPVE
ncbi:carboxypeptidase-like regulatory domain-containing protein [Myxococcus xanthus]|uniref:carboxypeptidase-like regulatory domain-containing protein n=1 Tax=Myxococcus xanthus TaxID=34 RepID=UPI001F352A82|nr:carboxypeptidase-like regulatory domain-containing protein [Myxococcus xanthus]